MAGIKESFNQSQHYRDVDAMAHHKGLLPNQHKGDWFSLQVDPCHPAKSGLEHFSNGLYSLKNKH